MKRIMSYWSVYMQGYECVCIKICIKTQPNDLVLVNFHASTLFAHIFLGIFKDDGSFVSIIWECTELKSI